MQPECHSDRSVTSIWIDFTHPRPPGWYRLSYKNSIEGSESLKGQFDFGNGCNDVHAVDLVKHPGEGGFSAVVFLPPPIYRLRIEAPGSDIVLLYDDVEFTKLGRLDSVAILAQRGLHRFVSDPVRFFKLLPEYIKGLRAGTFVNFRGSLPSHFAHEVDEVDYADWLKSNDYHPENDRVALRQQLSKLENTPLFSVCLSIDDSPREFVDATIRSVIGQQYENWQLCLILNPSIDAGIVELLKYWADTESRISLNSQSMDSSHNDLADIASETLQGEWSIFLDAYECLSENAFAEIVIAANGSEDASWVYSDGDRIDDQGIRFSHHFRSDWNREMFLAFDYIGRFSAFKMSLMKKVGGVEAVFDGLQTYELGLRVAGVIEDEQIIHIPKSLSHRRERVQYDSVGNADASVWAVEEYLLKSGISATVLPGNLETNRLSYELPDRKPKVTVIVPTRDGLDLLKVCCEGVLRATNYPDIQLIVVDNDSRDQKTLDYMKSLEIDERVHILHQPGAFNFSALNNRAAGVSDGSFLCFLNSDIEIIEANWLEEMVSQAARGTVGAVGAKLLYPDGSIQHAGVIVGVTGVAGHPFRHLPADAGGYHLRANITQEVSAVTAACLVVEKSKFLAVGGFDEEYLPVAYNDVDFCLKLQQSGLKNIYTPYATLKHHESATRGGENDPDKISRLSGELATMQSRWRLEDRYYNANLSKESEHFRLR